MKVDKTDFFKGDPYRSVLQPIFDDYRDEIREKAKVFFKGWKGNLRGWHRYLWNCHAFHNTLEDEKGGFHFFVNTRYIPLEPLLNKIRKAGMDIEQVKVSVVIESESVTTIQFSNIFSNGIKSAKGIRAWPSIPPPYIGVIRSSKDIKNRCS